MNAATWSKVALAWRWRHTTLADEGGVIDSATGRPQWSAFREDTAARCRNDGRPVGRGHRVDDASDSETVRTVKKLLQEPKSMHCSALGLANASRIQCWSDRQRCGELGTTAVVLPMDDKKRWVFKTKQNDASFQRVVAHMVKNA